MLIENVKGIVMAIVKYLKTLSQKVRIRAMLLLKKSFTVCGTILNGKMKIFDSKNMNRENSQGRKLSRLLNRLS